MNVFSNYFPCGNVCFTEKLCKSRKPTRINAGTLLLIIVKQTLTLKQTSKPQDNSINLQEMKVNTFQAQS